MVCFSIIGSSHSRLCRPFAWLPARSENDLFAVTLKDTVDALRAGQRLELMAELAQGCTHTHAHAYPTYRALGAQGVGEWLSGAHAAAVQRKNARIHMHTLIRHTGLWAHKAWVNGYQAHMPQQFSARKVDNARLDR